MPLGVSRRQDYSEAHAIPAIWDAKAESHPMAKHAAHLLDAFRFTSAPNTTTGMCMQVLDM